MERKIWCMVEYYPTPENKASAFFVHNRVKYYQNNGAAVEVISDSARSSYQFDGISVITKQDFLCRKHEWKDSILICHAANIRHQYFFLKKYGRCFRKIVMFFHGHEILNINKVYSEPYAFEKKNPAKELLQNGYDCLKIRLWTQFIREHMNSLFLFFVSGWMKRQFMAATGISDEEMKNHCSVTYNAVGEMFENSRFDKDSQKEYDFITIRGNLDNSKYAVDIVNELAGLNPQKKFLLIGRGKYFTYNRKADNLEWINDVLAHTEILQYLDKSRYALMPTRTDAQGVMACEIATTGMPLITSDIEVCHEVFDGFGNVRFIDNHHIKPFDETFLKGFGEGGSGKYKSARTNQKEFSIIQSLGRNE
ncbi:glycosyltransferase [Otoolea muris]|uniref:glycosyltransferase n=1 Tax=Otoolea muris TaxID=2941515 RepID=UPI00203CD629|nr:glycosyltransferase [Otoolea muris]